MFIVNLQHRNLSGVLDFDHKKRKLAVRVSGNIKALRGGPLPSFADLV